MSEEYLKKEDHVSCEECKCLIHKDDAQKVKYRDGYCTLDNYYCGEHNKPYNEIRAYDITNVRYYGEIQMELDGTPIGYKKIIKKK